MARPVHHAGSNPYRQPRSLALRDNTSQASTNIPASAKTGTIQIPVSPKMKGSRNVSGSVKK